jgi:hypothetical protein
MTPRGRNWCFTTLIVSILLLCAVSYVCPASIIISNSIRIQREHPPFLPSDPATIGLTIFDDPKNLRLASSQGTISVSRWHVQMPQPKLTGGDGWIDMRDVKRFPGFVLVRERPMNPKFYGGMLAWHVEVHYVLLLVVPLCVWAVGIYRSRLRQCQTGFCTVCGYDLRASANRCPECGAVPLPR